MTGKYNAALARLIKEKRLDVRVARYSSEREYRVAAVQPKWKQRPPERECDENGRPLRKRRKSERDAKRAMSKTAKRRMRKEARLCVGCGCARDGEFLSCSACRARNLSYYKKRKAAALSTSPTVERKCMRCRNEAMEGKTMCAEHLEWMKTRRRHQYLKRKALGICDVCREPSPTVVCQSCRMRRLERKAA